MQNERPRLPWVTGLLLALALALWLAPEGVRQACLYDRRALLQGQLWRLWTGHWVHFSGSHLGWNLLVVAVAGTWIERAGFRGGVWLAALAPPVISIVLLLGEPTLQQFGGLSGVATAAVVFACGAEWRRSASDRIYWGAVVVLVALKVGWEYLSGGSLFAQYGQTGVHTVPLSHLAGFCVGGLLSFRTRREASR